MNGLYACTPNGTPLFPKSTTEHLLGMINQIDNDLVLCRMAITQLYKEEALFQIELMKL